MNKKTILQSKTFWLAALQATAGAITIFATEYSEIGWLALVKSVVDVYLRSVTSQPVR
jgi:hypothetical protein